MKIKQIFTMFLCIVLITCSIDYSALAEENDGQGTEHIHNYTYVDKENGTHNKMCECMEEPENEHHEFIDGVCACGAYEGEKDEETKDHVLSYVTNNDGTHKVNCSIEGCKEHSGNEECNSEKEDICEKCGWSISNDFYGIATVSSDELPESGEWEYQGIKFTSDEVSLFHSIWDYTGNAAAEVKKYSAQYLLQICASKEVGDEFCIIGVEELGKGNSAEIFCYYDDKPENIIWESSDPSVVEISDNKGVWRYRTLENGNGKYTACNTIVGKEIGTSTITAKLDNGRIASYVVTVSDDIIGSGKCGDNAYWSLNTQGELRIQGVGSMYGYISADYAQSAGWTNATKVIIENGITKIGTYEFYDCKQIEVVEIPKSVLEIGKFSFYGCKKLKVISDCENIKIIGEAAFEGCQSLDIIDAIGPNTEVIGVGAFYGCKQRESLRLPSSVKSIGRSAFNNITRVFIPKSVDYIGYDSFAKDRTFIYVESGEDGNDWDENWWLGDIVEYDVKPSDFEYWLQYWNNEYTAVDEFVIPEGIELIPTGALNNCSFKTLKIPSSVKNIQEKALVGSITGFYYIPKTVKELGRVKTGTNTYIIQEVVGDYSGGLFFEGNNWSVNEDGLVSKFYNSTMEEYEYWANIDMDATELRIREGITRIPAGLIYLSSHNRTKWKSIIVPSSIEYIATHAFSEYGYIRREFNVITPCNYVEDYDLKYHVSIGEWQQDNNDMHYKLCDQCGTKVEEEGHIWGEWIVETPANHVTTGLNKRVCSVCGKEETETIATIPHSYSVEWSNDDVNHWHECECGDKKDEATHTWSSWETVAPATHFSAGTNKRVCAVCGKEETETIAIIPHSYSSEWEKSFEGHWHECECGDKKDELSHSWTAWETVIPATHLTEGVKKHSCSICDYQETDIVEKKEGHEFGDNWQKNADEHWKVCTCGAITSTNTHSMSTTWEVIVEPTYSSVGKEKKSCECGYTIYQDIPRRSQEEITIEVVPSEAGAPDSSVINLPNIVKDNIYGDLLISEKAEFDSGNPVKVYTKVNSATVSEIIKNKAEAAAGPESNVCIYLDILLYVKVGSQPERSIEPGGPVTVKFELPEEYKNTDSSKIRTYKIVHMLSNGDVETLTCYYNSNDNTITFTTTSFSEFALAYMDTDIKNDISYHIESDSKVSREVNTGKSEEKTIVITPSLPYMTISGLSTSKLGDMTADLKALNTTERDRVNHIIFSNYYASKKNLKATVLDTKDIYAPSSVSKEWKATNRILTWKNSGAKLGDLIYVTWYCQEAHDMRFIPAIVSGDGTVYFAVPCTGNVSTVSIVKLTF